MRPIHIVRLDKSRPALVLTREAVRPYIGRFTVAPITSTIRGLSTEVRLGPRNGVDHECVVSCDNIVTVPVDAVGRQVGYLWEEQEADLAEAIANAFELRPD
ncbi:type II toxin-antitoxin system PemK/MazF family toxin [Jiangella anatolica]|uniref:mRNA interferase MazF3 n=1 Tax=Jiangella anatolica TaxID=2670374 RepID=A0A2W2CAV0_9ACTN|nr:type II toxin-antitoxin system PemK/MazF family toxin [Jiangella anatolica]PZF85309.1 mRNA interferase MazF3 [Jiangella anatolica]